MRRVGFEPTYSKRTGLQPVAFDQLCHLLVICIPGRFTSEIEGCVWTTLVKSPVRRGSSSCTVSVGDPAVTVTCCGELVSPHVPFTQISGIELHPCMLFSVLTCFTLESVSIFHHASVLFFRSLYIVDRSAFSIVGRFECDIHTSSTIGRVFVRVFECATCERFQTHCPRVLSNACIRHDVTLVFTPECGARKWMGHRVGLGHIRSPSNSNRF